MARTITSVNVQLGFEYEKFKRGVDGSISAWRNFSKIARDSVPELERYNKAISDVDQGFETGTIGAKQYGLMIDQVNYSFKQGEYAVKQFSDENRQYLEDLKRASELSLGTAERRQTEYNASVAEAERLHKRGFLSLEAYTKRTEELNKEYLGIATSAEKAAAAEKILNSAREKTERFIRSAETSVQKFTRELKENIEAARIAGKSYDDIRGAVDALRQSYGILTGSQRKAAEAAEAEAKALRDAEEESKRLEKQQSQLLEMEQKLDAHIRKRARREAEAQARAFAEAQAYANSVIASGATKFERYISSIEKFRSAAKAAKMSSEDIAKGIDVINAQFEKDIDAGIRKRAREEAARQSKTLADAQSHVNSVIASGMTVMEKYEAAIREFMSAAAVAKISADDLAKGISAINKQFNMGGKSLMIEKLTQWQEGAGSVSSKMIRQLTSWVEKQKELIASEEKLIAAEREIDAGIRRRARQEAADAAKSLADAQKYVNSVLASGMSNWDRYIAELNRFRDAAAKAGASIKDFAAGEAAIRKKFSIQTPDEFFEDQQLQIAAEAADRLEKAVRRVDAAVLSGTSNWDKYQKELQQFQQDAALAGTSSQDIDTGEAGIRKKFGILTSTEFFANQRKQEDDARKDRIAQLKRESMTFGEVFNARMQELDSLRAAGLDSDTYWRQTKKLNDELTKQAGIVSGGGGAGGGGFGRSLTSAIGMLGLKYYAVTQAISAVSAGVRTALNFDRQTVAFASLTGSVGEAKDMMDGFLKLSEKAPLSITAMQGGARTMLSFGASAKEAGAAVEMIAKITGGDEMRFQNMSLAFSQIRAGGRLMGQELRQMIDAGFNPLEHISAQTGVSMMELRKIMEDGGLSFDMVRQAMEEATTGGGRFANLLDDIAETASGKLQNTIAQANRAIIDFASFMDFDIKNIVDGLSNLASILKVVLTPPLYVVVKALSFFATGINSLVAAFNQLVIAGQSFVSWIDSFMPKGSGLSDVFKQIGKDLYAVYEFFGGGEFGEQLRQTESLLSSPANEGQKAADGVEKIGGAYKSLNDATKVASDATNEYYTELEQRFSAALKSSGKYTEAQLKIAEIESRGIKLNDIQKRGIIDRTAAIERFEKQVRDAQEAEKKIEKQREEATKRQLEQAEKAKKAYEEQQEKLRDLMKELRPQDEAKRKVDEVIAQMNELDRMFGLRNLGISSKDINRVVASRAGATQGESLDYRLGEAVQAGSSAAIQKLYDFQVKQDTSDILTDISQTSRDQLDLLRQKLDNGVVLAGARS